MINFLYFYDFQIFENKQPKLGSIEHAEWQSKMNDVNGLADIILGKQRHGPIGSVELSFEGQFTRFGNLVKSYQKNIETDSNF